jgi:HAD superfamily hydrolase (TIGR01509 family)
MYKSILFDMDGVLINSMPCHLAAFNECLQDFNIKICAEQIGGRSTRSLLTELLKKDVSSYEIEAIAKAKTQRSLELMSDFGEQLLNEGAIEILSYFSKMLPLALCTSASPASVEFVLKELLPSSFFSAVVHSGQVKLAKPNPEIYQKAIRELALEPAQCLVVEDSPSGIESGLAAGCNVAHLICHEGAPSSFSEKITRISSLYDLKLLDGLKQMAKN